MTNINFRKAVRFIGGSVVIAFLFWLLIVCRVTGSHDLVEILEFSSETILYGSHFRFVQFFEGISILLGLIGAYLIIETQNLIKALISPIRQFLNRFWRAK